MSELAKRLREWADHPSIRFGAMEPDLRAAAEIVERAEWKPIAGAPKDGTSILAWRDPWQEPIKVWWCDDGLETDDDEPGWIDGERNKYEQYYTNNPTHYCPLPAPPEVKP